MDIDIMKLWIARDKNGELWLYDTKPIKDEIFFDVETFAMRMELKPTLFPEVTFENSPQEVELKLVENYG